MLSRTYTQRLLLSTTSIKTLCAPFHVTYSIDAEKISKRIKIHAPSSAQSTTPIQKKQLHEPYTPPEIPLSPKDRFRTLLFAGSDDDMKIPINNAIIATFDRYHDSFRKWMPSLTAAALLLGLFVVVWRGNNEQDAIDDVVYQLKMIMSPEEDFLRHGFVSQEQFLQKQTDMLRFIDYITQNPYNWSVLAQCDIIDALTHVLKSDPHQEHITYACRALLRLLDANTFQASIKQHVSPNEILLLIKSMKGETEARGDLCHFLVQYVNKVADKQGIRENEFVSIVMSMLSDPSLQAKRVSSAILLVMLRQQVQKDNLVFDQFTKNLFAQFASKTEFEKIKDKTVQNFIYEFLDEYIKQQNDSSIKLDFENKPSFLTRIGTLGAGELQDSIGNLIIIPTFYAFIRNWVRFNTLGVHGPILLIRYALPKTVFIPLVMLPVLIWDRVNEHFKKQIFFEAKELPRKEQVPIYPLIKYGPEFAWIALLNFKFPFLIFPYIHAVLLGGELSRIHLNRYFLGYSRVPVHDFAP
jgi:hypothetical protein